ncbi:MAG: hypothetical protein ACI38A_07465 [Candidatus Ornithomonoglobus sp.]
MIINIKPPPAPPKEASAEYQNSLYCWCAELAESVNRMMMNLDDNNIKSLSFDKLTDVSISDEDIVSLSYSKLTDVPGAAANGS